MDSGNREDKYIHDHKDFCAEFRSRLGERFDKLLFDRSIGPRHDALKEEDFKPCEDRRLEHYSTRSNQGVVDEVYRVGFVEPRWLAAAGFARGVIAAFEDTEHAIPPNDEIKSLKRSLAALKPRQPASRPRDWSNEDWARFHSFEEQKGRLAQLQEAVSKGGREQSGLAVSHAENYAARLFSYRVQHLTFCMFGDAAPGSKGKFSGRGLPFLTAKITNRLFDLHEDKNRLAARDVSQSYARGANRVAVFNSARWKQAWED